jgi:hypothetical protein
MNATAFMSSLLEQNMAVNNLDASLHGIEKELMKEEHNSIISEGSDEKFSAKVKQVTKKMIDRVVEFLKKLKNWFVTKFREVKKKCNEVFNKLNKKKAKKTEVSVNSPINLEETSHLLVRNINLIESGLRSVYAIVGKSIDSITANTNDNVPERLAGEVSEELESIRKLGDSIVEKDTQYKVSDLEKVKSMSKNITDSLEKVDSVIAGQIKNIDKQIESLKVVSLGLIPLGKEKEIIESIFKLTGILAEVISTTTQQNMKISGDVVRANQACASVISRLTE